MRVRFDGVSIFESDNHGECRIAAIFEVRNETFIALLLWILSMDGWAATANCHITGSGGRHWQHRRTETSNFFPNQFLQSSPVQVFIFKREVEGSMITYWFVFRAVKLTEEGVGQGFFNCDTLFGMHRQHPAQEIDRIIRGRWKLLLQWDGRLAR